MNHLNRAKIYKIVSDEDDLVYIGATTAPRLARRLHEHKHDLDRYNNGLRKCTVSSFKILTKRGARIELIENWPCQTKAELNEREKYHIELAGDRAVNIKR